MKRPAKFSKLQIFDVHFGMFDCAVRICVGPFDLGAEYVKWLYDLPELPSTKYALRGRFYSKGDHVAVLWIPRRPRTSREHATLAHESLHAVNWLMEWASMPFSNDSEEGYCHALGHLVNAVLERVKA